MVSRIAGFSRRNEGGFESLLARTQRDPKAQPSQKKFVQSDSFSYDIFNRRTGHLCVQGDQNVIHVRL